MYDYLPHTITLGPRVSDDRVVPAIRKALRLSMQLGRYRPTEVVVTHRQYIWLVTAMATQVAYDPISTMRATIFGLTIRVKD